MMKRRFEEPRKANENVGIVEEVLDGGQKILLRSLRGGTIICNNKGFEKGELLCYTINLETKKIVELIPKKIADAMVILGTQPTIQRIVEVSHGTDGFESSDCGEGLQNPFAADCGGGEDGNTHIIGASIPDNSSEDFNPSWSGDFRFVEEEDGEDNCLYLPIPPESNDF